ncbi:polyprenol phosphomannose-dependent alpha 1,6 mannosyltransferase MptB [Streptomyces gilvosporeus]|uniref:DUF2029 domain-containing protein n=1 Tax=Streptomyces gilvosporeus TaxID=553510 RepID=A0A1V0TJR8_9ACTN|nr:polyprenol phosphomannose-dependent alpha 1,6 mannosyltransferase MptB [Streptomyces gilvosporeus]ARF53187.1 hypothetical protein B1H19_02480 [Streptomyces gilvosporeus]
MERTIRGHAAQGALGSALLAAGGWGAGALTTGEPSGLWGIPAPPLVVLGAVMAYAGLTLLVVAWWRLGSAVRNGRVMSRRQRWVVLGWWALPMAACPLLFSSDAYSYVAQGAIAHQGWDVYGVGPSVLGGGLAGNVPAMWRGTPAPYGPLSVAMSETVVSVTGEQRVVVAVLGLRLLALAGLVLLAWAVQRLAAVTGVTPCGAWWAAPLNPLVLVHLVGGAHNEALMVGLMMVGFVAFGGGRWVVGTLAMISAVLVKAPAAVALLCAAVVAVAGQPGGRRRCRRAVEITVVAVAGLLAGVALCGRGWGWLHTAGESDRVFTALSLSTDAGRVWGAATQALGWGTTDDAVTLARGVGLAGGACAVAWCAWRAPRTGAAYAAGRGLLAVVVSAPVVQPWYLLWGGVPLAAVAWPVLARPWAKATMVGMLLVVLPSGLGLTWAYGMAAVTGVSLTSVGLAAWAVWRRPVPAVGAAPARALR